MKRQGMRYGVAGIAIAAATMVLFAAPAGNAAADDVPVYQNRSYTFGERAADLVSRMTTAQKASEMNSSMAAAISGLGVSAYSWWNEAAHGVACEGTINNANCSELTNTTSYPTSLALGSTWDPALMYREASTIGDEAREVESNNDLNMDFYAPVVNLMRDPRWGRSDEAFSEDPFLTAQMASQYVDGMQGQDSSGRLLSSADGYSKTLTTLKHYAANNSEVNRLNGSADMDQRTLEEYYTDQFRRTVQQAHPGSIMSSYNSINGTPSPVNVFLQDTLARETWGFGGYFTSDCDAVYEVQNGHHWTAPGFSTPVDQNTRQAFALSAGEDLDCNEGYNDGQNYANQLPTAVANHVQTQTDTLSDNDLDVATERLFTARMQLGEFDDSAGVVPWVNDARSRVPQGSWTNSDANHAVTETPDRLALARQAGDESIVLLKNAATKRKDGTRGRLLPLKVPTSGPFTVAVVGYFANPGTMYLGDYSSIQGSFGTANEVNGFTGIKNAIQAIDPQAVVTWYPGVVGGTSANQLNTVDPASVQAAGAADAVIVYAGADSSTATEAQDRPNVSLPGAQASMISQVAAANPNTIVYMETGGMEDVTSFEPHVSAMLWSAYNGMRKGEALADVLLGNADPSGHLPFTWYHDNSDLPAITDYTLRADNGDPGRTYQYYGGPVSYPFGYGLSYTTFKFSLLHVDNTAPSANDTIQVATHIKNTGTQAGAQIVQLYATTPDAPAALERPAKRLVGFQRVALDPGQTKVVTFKLKVPDLAFYDEATRRWAVDDGRYGLQIATSSADSDVAGQTFIDVTGALTPTVSVVTAKPTAPTDAASDVHDRLIFPANTMVQPNLTVAMTDDTLYGYVTKGQSTPLPAGMTVGYISDRPSVVAVHKGVLTTTSTRGPATITASVTYQGVTKVAKFVVYNSGS